MAKSRALAGPSPEAMVSRASLRRNGPRSGLSREASERGGVSGVAFFLEREGEGEGAFLGSGDGDGLLWLSGTDTRSGAASGGVFTETRPGMVEGVCDL